MYETGETRTLVKKIQTAMTRLAVMLVRQPLVCSFFKKATLVCRCKVYQLSYVAL